MALSTATLLLVVTAVSHSAQGRIAVAGPWGTGYVGLLAKNGMPRERLLHPQLADPEVLRRYDAIIVSGPVQNWGAALAAIEGYVREGGCALLECGATPSAEVFPGPRIGAQAAPNFVIEAADHPAVANLAVGTTFTHTPYSAAAIVPDASANATVLARFTEVGAGNKVRGKFVLNGQSVPAIIHRKLGEGHLIYSGPWLGYAMGFGRDHSELIFALLRFLTDGNVIPRLSLAGTDNLLTACPWGRQAPADGTPPEPALPEGFTLVENLGPAFEEYSLIGALEGSADILLDYTGPDRHYALRVENGRPIGITGPRGAAIEASRPIQAPTGAQVVIARRQGSIRVLIDGDEVYGAADRGEWGGAVACKGLSEPSVQPVEEVRFSDDFMQEAGEAAMWKPVLGNWQVISTEGAPATGANPFSYGAETDDVGLATAGEWFWDDYRVEASVRWTQNVAGVAVHYRDPQNYDALTADIAAQAVQLVRVRGGETQVLKETPVELRPWQWYRLGVRASRGLIACWLDGRPLFDVAALPAGCGPIGLYVRGAKAAFDDVEVGHWLAGPQLANQASWRPTGDTTWQLKQGGAFVRGLLQAAGHWGDVSASAEVRLGKAQQVGIRLRDDGSASCAAIVERGGNGLVLKLLHLREGAKPVVLGSEPIKGASAKDWLRMSVKAVRERIFCAIDGSAALIRVAPIPSAGAVGLFAAGTTAGEFRGVDIRPANSGLRPADPPTPAYAGAVDVMTWAGVAFSWLPDPDDLALFWHEGQAPGAARVRVGVHKGGANEAVAEAFLAGAGRNATSGYVARFAHTWGGPDVSVSLSRGGKVVADAKYSGPIPESGFLAEVERSGPTLILRVNGSVAVAFNDTAGALDCERVGVRLTGATLCSDDLILERSQVRMYTFARAPSDWLVQRGAWEVTSRWTCAPGWTWLSGVDPRHALVQSKWRVEGDVMLDAYVGAKMVATPSGRKEVLRDLRLGICGKPGYLNAGYLFLIGAKGGSWTALQRNGLVVAQTSDFVIPQGSVHNDWLRLGVSKRGGEVTLLSQGQPVLSYTDPDPLSGGAVSVGTYDNGVMIPRVTVHGDVRP